MTVWRVSTTFFKKIQSALFGEVNGQIFGA